MTGNDPAASTIDLRAVIARLREIERKCSAMGTKSEEFPLMQQKVADIIARLEAGSEPSGDALDFRRIGRELFPVAHLFESTGFMSVGKEIAHIERSLTELAPEPAAPESRTPVVQSTASTSSSAAKRSAEPPQTAEPEEPDPRSVPLPIIVGFLALLLVIVGSAAIVFRSGPRGRSAPQVAPKPTAGIPAAVMTEPAPRPEPSAVPTAHPSPTPPLIDHIRLSEEVAAARLALVKGDLEGAATHLSEAARIDRRDADVVEIAGEVVRGLVHWAYGAADNAEWDRVPPLLERAQRVAMRFGISTAQIERARAEIAVMERYVIVGPGDRRTILEHQGRRVEVHVIDGGTRIGKIVGIQGGSLVLDMDTEVGGGVVRFTEELPLSGIRSLKIFTD